MSDPRETGRSGAQQVESVKAGRFFRLAKEVSGPDDKSRKITVWFDTELGVVTEQPPSLEALTYPASQADQRRVLVEGVDGMVCDIKPEAVLDFVAPLIVGFGTAHPDRVLVVKDGISGDVLPEMVGLKPEHLGSIKSFFQPSTAI